MVEILTIPNFPLVKSGDDLAVLIIDGVKRLGVTPQAGDIFVLAQKIVSKAEGRLIDLSTVQPSQDNLNLAALVEKDPRLVELVMSEAVYIVYSRPGLLLVETKFGFVMPNAGIDQSNVEGDHALLLPVDPDASARKLRKQLSEAFKVDVAVIINDSVSRPWRAGTCGIAIGAAGLPVLDDLRGETDLFGRELKFSITGRADEIAAAASLVMGQRNEGTPVVLLRGVGAGCALNGTARELTRRPTVIPLLYGGKAKRAGSMLDYVYGYDKLIGDFVAQLIPHCRRGFGPNIKTIGVINERGELIAGLVYHNWDPDAGIIEISGAALPRVHWLTRRTLERMYSYPFEECNCQMVVQRTPSDDRRLLGILAAYGFDLVTVQRLFGRERDGVICTLTVEAWRNNKFNRKRLKRGAALKEAA